VGANEWSWTLVAAPRNSETANLYDHRSLTSRLFLDASVA
jgi:hypothetical protein